MIGPTAFDRPAALRRLADDPFDVLVVGGGVTGSGCALDAASRGLRTALVEAGDFASGTSSKSSKLIHGGLRYLQNGDFRLVYEALHERHRLLRNAPHLVKLMPFLLPVLTGRDSPVPRKLARALGYAMWAYDLTGGFRIGKFHQRLTAEQALAHMPTLPAEKLSSAYLYWDAQADDARLTLTLARTAALDHGAVVANRARLTGVAKDAAGRVEAAYVEADGHVIEVRCSAVVNATGVWADDVRALDEGHHPGTIRPAKGIHITVPWSKVRNDIAAVIPVPHDKRSVFVVPWPVADGEEPRFSYVGTTDTDYDGPLDDPQCTTADVEYLLGALRASVTTEISEDDVVGTWAGLRPLVKAKAGRTADLSRRHHVGVSPAGMVTITGGKLTTYREMAADAVDKVVKLLAESIESRVTQRSRTKHLRLHGAAGYAELLADTATPAAAAAVSTATVEHLAGRFGGDARTVLALIEHDPSLGEPLVEGLPYVTAEAVYAARYEMALTVDDVLSRRTRARLLARDASEKAAPRVAEILAGELGIGDSEQSQQLDAFRAAVAEDRVAPPVASPG